MALRLDDKFIKPFITDEELAAIAPEVDAAAASLRAGTGKGSEMLGWLNLPENYDKEEFARITAAAEKITVPRARPQYAYAGNSDGSKA